ncbi:uncharacterized protein LOC115769438 [Drosophila novamexicana]|uniref:uncharacterized protein LOC115769438 n=1 Tax=Drosophila novamexicana TaxID=47314 RepID=UPI0011E5C503|nr:uncharacterized protein LOC115769438 [Drosophila novamexicana]
MWFRLGLGISLTVLLCNTLCAAEKLAQNNVNPSDSEEAHKLEVLLESTRTSTTPKPISSSTTKTSTYETHIEDHEYNFKNDRLPALTEDEFNSLSHDANPLHFLKQLTEPPADTTEPQVDPTKPPPDPTKSQTESTQPQNTKADPIPGTPIYITIPIYINTSGKMPISLTIGDKELPLQRRSSAEKKNHSTKSPNSYFNRLLEKIEPPKRRTTNRHRSQSRSKIQALKERNASQLYKKLSAAESEEQKEF